jgi:two-component system catabolic regulation response regulator CreB
VICLNQVVSHSVLLVEDEPLIAENLLYALQTEGFQAQHSETLGEAEEKLKSTPIDIVVLDINLPDGNGFDFFHIVHDRYAKPVIFLTARSSEIDRVLGLEMGGDDYVVKPVSPRELAARVKAVLRRTQQPDGGEQQSTKIRYLPTVFA